jgi:hypothetical protein
VAFIDLKRILTIRTQYLLINQTKESFELLLRSVEDERQITLEAG